MPYNPREGVDYLIDLYAVAQVDSAAPPGDISSAINGRLMHYHPDRLQGLAPEFIAKGEAVTRALHHAKEILLNEVKRTEYDDILKAWDGPLSDDGRPVMDVEDYMRADLQYASPDEVEAVFADIERQAATLSGHEPDGVATAEHVMALLANAESAPEDLLRAQRAAYENALLREDRVLAVSENRRALFMGMGNTSATEYRTGIGYPQKLAKEIEAARATNLEMLRLRALGGVSTRLALMAGESASETALLPVSTASVQLPAYFDTQSEKLREIARKREVILHKRLDNIEWVYPAAELQTQVLGRLLLGAYHRDAGRYIWFSATGFDTELQVDALTDEDIIVQLEARDYSSVVENDNNVMLFPLLEHIELGTLLGAAIQHHLGKYQTPVEK